MGAGSAAQGCRLRHAHPGLRRQHLQRADLVERAGRRVVRVGSLQHRRLLQGGRGRGHLGDGHQGVVPQRRAGGGQAATPASAVLLRVLFAAARAAHHGRSGRRGRQGTPRAVRLAAQRHSSVDRGRRTHAVAGRRAPAGVGRGVGHHGRDVRLHQPHPAARGAGDLAARDVRRVAAPPPRDHLRDQPPVPRRGAHAVPRRRGPGPPDVADRRGRRQERPDGTPRDRRQPCHQRCRGAALGPAESQCAQRLLRDVAGAVQQQDQRCDATPFPCAGQPRSAGAAGPHRRRRLADRSGPLARAGAARRRCRLPSAVARRQTQQQGAPRQVHPLGWRASS